MPVVWPLFSSFSPLILFLLFGILVSLSLCVLYQLLQARQDKPLFMRDKLWAQIGDFSASCLLPLNTYLLSWDHPPPISIELTEITRIQPLPVCLLLLLTLSPGAEPRPFLFLPSTTIRRLKGRRTNSLIYIRLDAPFNLVHKFLCLSPIVPVSLII